MEIILKAVAEVKNSRHDTSDDFWGDIISEITLMPEIPSMAFEGIMNFSHLEIIYYFNKVDPQKIVYSGHPRGNPKWPVMGIFCQRKKDRPNQLGLCTVELVEQKERSIFVKYLDATAGTPILDIKPVFKEFDLNGKRKQPGWVATLMKDYWK